MGQPISIFILVSQPAVARNKFVISFFPSVDFSHFNFWTFANTAPYFYMLCFFQGRLKHLSRRHCYNVYISKSGCWLAITIRKTLVEFCVTVFMGASTLSKTTILHLFFFLTTLELNARK